MGKTKHRMLIASEKNIELLVGKTITENVMKSSEEKIGGTATLEALQTYTRRLDEEYGKKALQHFSDADMQILFENDS